VASINTLIAYVTKPHYFFLMPGILVRSLHLTLEGSWCGRLAAGVSALGLLVAKARLAASTLGCGVTQYSGRGFSPIYGVSGMPLAWADAQATCNVRRHASGHAREFLLRLWREMSVNSSGGISIRSTNAWCTHQIAVGCPKRSIV